MQDDVDARIGQIFVRLSRLRIELGDGALDRTVHALLHALGASALREAERRARSLAARHQPLATDIAVRPYDQRRPPEPLDEGA